MGCAPSMIGDESISRCKDRKLLLKQALAARTAFSAAHCSYAAALLATALALHRYAQGEAEVPHISTFTMPEVPASKRLVLEEPLKAWHTKLKRSVLKIDSASIPKDDAVLRDKQKRGVSKLDFVSVSGNDAASAEQDKIWDFFLSMNTTEPEMATPEKEEGEDDDGDEEELLFRTPDSVSKMEDDEEEEEAETPLPLQTQFMNLKAATAEIRRASNVNWFKAVEKIHDHFLEASKCAREASRLLEPNRYRYRRNDEHFRVDHAARVLRVITWKHPGDDGNGTNDFSAEANEPHAVVLDKLLAWEKKLYNEVKSSELMKREYQRKVLLLAKQKKCGASAETLEKTKAAVHHLQIRYVVDMQLMDSTVSEVNNIRDCQLYPKLVELVGGMANMWENISTHHDNQLRIVTDLKFRDISGVPGETTWSHYEQTTKFLSVVEGWQTQFEKLVAHQNSYVSALNSWLKLNLIPINSSLKQKLSYSSRIPNPPIQTLLCSWQEYIENLPDEPVIKAISSFAATMKIIVLLQEEEMELKDKYEETRKDYLRKYQAFEEWLHKHKQSARVDATDEQGADKDLVLERRFVVESLKKRLDKEMEDHRKHCVRVREKSIRGLWKWLPGIFRAMSDYAHACAEMYNRVRCIALSENPTNVNADPS